MGTKQTQTNEILKHPFPQQRPDVKIVESGGRTIFFRRYDGRYLRGHDLVSKYPNNRRIVINDVAYVHSDCSGWAHDQLTSASVGLISSLM